MTSIQQPPKRLYSLDVLRAIGSVGVVVHHWPYLFFSAAKRATAYEQAQLPLAQVLSIFYRRGMLAVDLFLCLSGFVFYWLYSKRVSERAISARDFFVMRLSRLYPVHLLTLLWVAIGQASFRQITSTYFVYPNNDPYHFVLNLFFVSSWGLEKGYSFNNPVWAVSVQVAMYGVFFLLCRLLPVRGVVLAAVSAFGFLVVGRVYEPLGRGLGSFFLGGCVYLTYAWIVKTARTQKALKFLPGLVLGLWVFAVAAVYKGWDMGSQPLVSRLSFIYPVALLFPLTILTLSLVETQRGAMGDRIAVLGDVSYSAYLLHFPLQLSIATITTWVGTKSSIFYSPLVLFAFIAGLWAISYASFLYFERPAQARIRAWWLASRSRDARL